MMHLNVNMSSIHLRSPFHELTDALRTIFSLRCATNPSRTVQDIDRLIISVLIKGSFRSIGRHPDVQQVDEKQKGQLSYRAVDIYSKDCLSFRWLTSLWAFFNCSSVSFWKAQIYSGGIYFCLLPYRIVTKSVKTFERVSLTNPKRIFIVKDGDFTIL